VPPYQTTMEPRLAAHAPPALPLRPYQAEAITAIEQAEARGIQRPLIVCPTGTGKTVVFAHLIARRPGRALVLAHRDELLAQAAGKLRQVDPAAEVGIVKAERDEAGAEIVVASVQTLARPSRLARVGGFSTVVVDEAHHAAADTYLAVLRHLGAFDADGPLTVGVTATPERADDRKLGAVWEEIVYQRGIIEMIAEGYLCDLRGQVVGTDADLGRLRVSHGDLVESEVADELVRSGALAQVAGAWVQYAAGRKGLAFLPSVLTAHLLAAELAGRGITAEALDGTTPAEERRGILGRLHTGATQVVCNCGVLVEGFDEPTIACVLVARPTRSKVLYQQMAGRGTRKAPGKDDCLILDLAGVTARHDLATVASLAELDPAELEGKTLTEALAAKRAAEEELQGTGESGGEETLQLPGVTAAVALFQSLMRWVPAGPAYVLNAGPGAMVKLTPAGGDTWRVEGHRRGNPPKVLADGLSLEYAQGLGEDVVRRLGAGQLAAADAAWRGRPASPKQLAALARWRIKAPAGVTRGAASDLLAAKIVVKGEA